MPGNQFPDNTATIYEIKKDKGNQMQSNPGPGNSNKYVSGVQK